MRPAAVLAPLVPLLLVTGCGTDPTTTVETGAGRGTPGSWTSLGPSPLSPREGSVAASVGGEAVFVGGYSGPACPPGADCAVDRDDYESDGAAYDPVERTWRRIADAPRRVPPGSAAVVVGEDLVVRVDDVLLGWDSAEDSWSETPLPADAPDHTSELAADGPRVVLASGSDEHAEAPDLLLDTVTGSWSRLPPDPFSPAYDRRITPTPDGLVLTAQSIGSDGGPVDPSLVRAAVLPRGSRAWRTLPPSDQLGGSRWTWTGTRLVDATPGGADGGEVNGYGRVIPFGGRLDPVTGTWSRLPDPPAENTGGWLVEASAGPLVATAGWIYDDERGSWTRLVPPIDGPDEPGPGVWVDGRLVVLGGGTWDGGRGAGDVWSTEGWSYAP